MDIKEGSVENLVQYNEITGEIDGESGGTSTSRYNEKRRPRIPVYGKEIRLSLFPYQLIILSKYQKCAAKAKFKKPEPKSISIALFQVMRKYEKLVTSRQNRNRGPG